MRPVRRPDPGRLQIRNDAAMIKRWIALLLLALPFFVSVVLPLFAS